MPLQTRISQLIDNKDITFEHFMNLALYEPKLGYYHNPNTIFGKEGDYITAPELSPIFSKCLANHCQELLQSIPKGNILEFGAGTGKMAAHVILRLDELQSLPNKYYILEISPYLKSLQQQTIAYLCPELQNRFEWITSLPKQSFDGVILANEVLDAMPVNKFNISDTIQEYYVTKENDEFQWKLKKLSSPNYMPHLKKIKEKYLSNCDSYDLEINFYAPRWLQSIYDFLKIGNVLIIDYGFHEATLYHPSRHMGTIMCHHKHKSNPNPLINIGNQDITAHVNFSQIANCAYDIGFAITGYTNQADFLISSGIMQFINNSDEVLQYNNSQQVKMLTLPSEMGELFKIISLSKKNDIQTSSFCQKDLRHLL